MEVTFRVAGSGLEAGVSGFGAVFLDVDVADRTKIELFADDGRSPGRFAVPVRSDARGAGDCGNPSNS